MSDYSEYNEQLQRFRELLTALSDVIADLTPEDLDSWAAMKQRLPLQNRPRIVSSGSGKRGKNSEKWVTP
jgi:hypothetical protein